LYGSQGVVYNILECEHLRKKSPTSLADFAAKTDRVFSPAFLHHLQQKCDAFDDMCGAPVADAFFGQKTYMEWAQLIAENCIRKLVDLPPNPTDWGRPGVGQAAPPITQIHLKGASIKDAWNDSPEALKISPSEQMSSHQQWTPADLGVTGAHVFHGTASHPKDSHEELLMDIALGSLPVHLVLSDGSNQLVPVGVDHWGIFTSFSAMRAFLWALFNAEVINDPTGSTPRSPGARTFTMRGTSYQGVILVRLFSSSSEPSQPSTSGLSSVIIPRGKETEWATATAAYTSGCQAFWLSRIQHVYQQPTEDYPDLIHGMDLPPLRNALQLLPCGQQLLWQTA
jgi:hypothetical protein